MDRRWRALGLKWFDRALLISNHSPSNDSHSVRSFPGHELETGVRRVDVGFEITPEIPDCTRTIIRGLIQDFTRHSPRKPKIRNRLISSHALCPLGYKYSIDMLLGLHHIRVRSLSDTTGWNYIHDNISLDPQILRDGFEGNMAEGV